MKEREREREMPFEISKRERQREREIKLSLTSFLSMLRTTPDSPCIFFLLSLMFINGFTASCLHGRERERERELDGYDKMMEYYQITAYI